jgi:hypothetical protein
MDACADSGLTAAHERSRDFRSAGDRELRRAEEGHGQAVLADLVNDCLLPAGVLVRWCLAQGRAQFTGLPTTVLAGRPPRSDLYAQHVRGRQERRVLL